ncbi:MAG: hypothetical protein KF873_09155 [Gemmataceae bacterium]|nr:hypothetical protein [Gemmataceae bacterium]
MAGRAFAFADPEIIRLARTEFVPACADDWYQCRRRDAEGRFWKRIISQGPRSVDALTHQGIYVFTADGELLAFKNAGQDVNATRDQIAMAMRKWNALPAERRKPGAIAIPEHGQPDRNYSRTPPDGGLIIRVHARILDRKGDGYVKGSCDFAGGDRAARDFLWLDSRDVNAIAMIQGTRGHKAALPNALVRRILRFHLVDNTRGEPEFWMPEDVRSSAMIATIEDMSTEGVTLRIDGEALLATDADQDKADRGYEVKLTGKIRVSAERVIKRFELVAIGDHWGSAKHTRNGERPGRGLLGITFELADPKITSNRVAPQGARDAVAYFRPN